MGLKRVCPKCRTIIDYTQRYCDECTAAYEANKTKNNRYYDKYRRNREGKLFYNSNEWQRVRDRVKARDKGLCRLCLTNNKIGYVDIVHHIEERTERKDLALNESNCISLCISCHNKVHAEYKKNKEQMQRLLLSIKG